MKSIASRINKTHFQDKLLVTSKKVQTANVLTATRYGEVTLTNQKINRESRFGQ